MQKNSLFFISIVIDRFLAIIIQREGTDIPENDSDTMLSLLPPFFIVI